MRTLTPYGRWLSITGNEGGLIGPWAFMLWVHEQGGSFRIHTAARGSAEIVAVNSGTRAQTIVREASINGSRIFSQEETAQGGTKFVWQGDFHEISTYVYGRDVPLELFAAKVAVLDLADGADGIVIRPAPGMGARISYGVGANFIPDLGTISVRAADSVDSRPAVPGRLVRGGRLWRDDLRDAGGTVTRTILTIINESTITTLTPFRPDDGRLRPLVESIDVRLN